MSLAAPPDPAILGLQFWVAAWYFILVLGCAGLVGAVWGRREVEWHGPDEVLRGIGTVAVSIGMLVLLHGLAPGAALILLALAATSFVLAHRHRRPRRPMIALTLDDSASSSGGTLKVSHPGPLAG